MKWIGGPVALRQRLDHSEATPATVGSELQFCDDPQIAHALRDTMPLRMLAGSHAQVALEI
jgi:hypothetical protein